MENKLEFKCQGDNLEEIPVQLAENIGISFPGVHSNSEDMSKLAKAVKNYTEAEICIIPFCTTVEAEGMGGKIKLGDSRTGPRVEEYLFETIEDMQGLKKIDFSQGRIKEVLAAVEKLSQEGEAVALNVEGPFTIISSLIDPMLFYRCLRKNKDMAMAFIKKVEDSIVEYILEGIKRGAKIISYGDPVGAIDLVGPKMYKEISGNSTYNILKRVEPELENAIVHLCGKTSTAFVELGLCEAGKLEFGSDLSYGKAICKIVNERPDIKIIGHSCIKRARNKMKNAVVWGISLR